MCSSDLRVGVLIGDVSGKGVSAALYMARIISEFRNVANVSDSPEDALQKLNSRLSRMRSTDCI